MTIVQPIVPRYRVPLFDALAQQPGIDLLVVSAPRGHGEYDAGHVTGLPYLDDAHPWRPLPPSGALLWQKGLGRLALGGPGDVLVVCGNVRYLSNYPLMWRAKHLGVGTVWWGHGRTRSDRKAGRVIRTLAMKMADAVLLYTDQESEACVAEGIPADKVHATSNTVDTVAIEQVRQAWSPERLGAFRLAQGLDRKQVLLYCGRLLPGRRVELALQALRQLKAEGLDVHLTVIGDGPARGELEMLAQSLGLADSVTWLGAIYDEAELAPWFLLAETLLHPGPIGLTLQHAFAYGLPVVTHDSSADHGPEIAALVDGANGLLFRDGDAQDLAGKARAILRDRALRQRLSRGALETMRDRYSLDHMVENFMDAVRYASNCALLRSEARSNPCA